MTISELDFEEMERRIAALQAAGQLPPFPVDKGIERLARQRGTNLLAGKALPILERSIIKALLEKEEDNEQHR